MEPWGGCLVDVRNRSVLLSGAGNGIGRALATELAERSCRLTLVGPRAAALEDVAALVREHGGQVHVVTADLTAPGVPVRVVNAAVERFGGVEVLVNNAGNVRVGRREPLEEAEVAAQIALDLIAPVLLTGSALPALRACGEALVVNVSSGIGLVELPYYATYAATEAGIAHIGDSLRRQLSGEGVRVLDVCCGATITPTMGNTRIGSAQGVGFESTEDVVAAVLEGIDASELRGGRLVRGEPTRHRMITFVRENLAAGDEISTARDGTLEQAVTDHSAL